MTSTPANPASRNALLDTLGTSFAVFRECRPLALGIHKAIIARMPEIDAAQLRLALRMRRLSIRQTGRYAHRFGMVASRHSVRTSSSEFRP